MKRIDRCSGRVWVEKYEAGEFDEDARVADLIQERDACVVKSENCRKFP